MKHVERHHSRHTPAQLFDLIADVEQYPDFIPWVISAHVTRREGATMWTELTMGTSVLSKQFTTVAVLDRPHRMEINSCDPMFERFEQIWTFETAAEGGTNVEYRLELMLKSQILQMLVGASFTEGIGAMVQAYMRRARRVYGVPESLPRKGPCSA